MVTVLLVALVTLCGCRHRVNVDPEGEVWRVEDGRVAAVMYPGVLVMAESIVWRGVLEPGAWDELPKHSYIIENADNELGWAPRFVSTNVFLEFEYLGLGKLLVHSGGEGGVVLYRDD